MNRVTTILLTSLFAAVMLAFGGIAVHAEENETEMTGGFVPVTLGGGNTEYSDPLSPDTEQTRPGSTDTTPYTPESTSEPAPLVKPISAPNAQDTPEPIGPQTESNTPDKPLPSDTYTDDHTSYNYEDNDHPDHSYGNRHGEPQTPSVSLTPGIRDTSRKNELNITARTDAKGNITLIWDKVRKADKYTVYLFDGKRYAKVGETVKNSFLYKGGKIGKTYKFMVRYTTGSETSNISDSFKITFTLKAAGKPVVTATAKGENATLSWNTVPYAKQYAVYRITGDKLEKVVNTTKTTAVIRRLPTDKGYAVKALINGKWTSVSKDDIAAVKE